MARLAALISLIVMLAGCGGGSSSADPGPAPAAVTVSGQVTFDFVPVVAWARARLRRDGRASRAGRHRRAAAKRRRHRQHDDGRNGQLFVRQRRRQHRRRAARASRDAACRCAELGFPRRRQRQRRRAVYARGRRVQHGRRERHAQSACRVRLDGSRVHGDALGRAVRDPRRGLRRRAAGADRGAEHRVPGATLQLEHAERAGCGHGPGEIGSSRYSAGTGIFLVGAADQDTDEYDRHVIAHEFGHYLEHRFSRSDSFGGPHALTDQLDLRVAFGEAWGSAFAGMVTGQPVYVDAHQRGSSASVQLRSRAAAEPRRIRIPAGSTRNRCNRCCSICTTTAATCRRAGSP